ncbi:probable calcium-binding protein CML34 [Gigantopelta aegis]|uniref:probable calcium-binding protein CML34 n=1 Tax=Gigantopelta aegis TaxID=1735272 RepID=UPI001B88C450|nr:probable calcium-binding protein CML34 [Gigantopelta aegis]
MRWLLAIIGLVQFYMSGVPASPGRPPLGAWVQQARILFHMVVNSNSTDASLTMPQIEYIFSKFDQNRDGRISESEFSQVWVHKGLGVQSSATFLFHHADTDSNGFISNNPDLARVFHYFDLDGNGKVNEPEFVITWAGLTH